MKIIKILLKYKYLIILESFENFLNFKYQMYIIKIIILTLTIVYD
jgi:hypothetical protein